MFQVDSAVEPWEAIAVIDFHRDVIRRIHGGVARIPIHFILRKGGEPSVRSEVSRVSILGWGVGLRNQAFRVEASTITSRKYVCGAFPHDRLQPVCVASTRPCQMTS